MFDRFLKNRHALARQQNGLPAEKPLHYLAHCAEQQLDESAVSAASTGDSSAADEPAERGSDRE